MGLETTQGLGLVFLGLPGIYSTVFLYSMNAHTMETQNNPTTVTRTDYVLTNLGGVKTPMEFKTAEKMASKRLTELEKVVQGVSSKWFKSKSDLEYIQQTKEEIGRIQEVLGEKRKRFGII